MKLLARALQAGTIAFDADAAALMGVVALGRGGFKGAAKELTRRPEARCTTSPSG